MKKIICFYLLLIWSEILFAQPPSNPNYFPIGVWLQSPFKALNYKAAGVNLYVALWNPLDQTQLTDLRNAGMRVICTQNTFGLSKLSDTLIYGWFGLQDEPDNAQWNSTTNQYDPCISPSLVVNDYTTTKSNDPSRPVFLNLGQGVSYINYIGRGTCSGQWSMYPDYNNGYLKGCDFAAFDIYPVNNTDATTSGNLWYVAKGIDSLRSWTNYAKPTWAWIETTKIDNNSNRQPTPAEVKSEVWMALIHGAKGVGYFCHSWTPSFNEWALLSDATMLSAVTSINNQVTFLAPVLNSATTSGYAAVSSSNTAVPINFMTKNLGGANYIFSVAMRPGSTTATFTVTSGTSVEVLGESRTIAISGGKFSDSFSSYGVHLYKITAATGINEAIVGNPITVFPNPGKGLFTLQSEIKISEINVFNFLGEKIMSLPVGNAYPDQLQVNLNGRPKGVYFYEALSSDKIVAKGKLLLE